MASGNSKARDAAVARTWRGIRQRHRQQRLQRRLVEFGAEDAGGAHARVAILHRDRDGLPRTALPEASNSRSASRRS